MRSRCRRSADHDGATHHCSGDRGVVRARGAAARRRLRTCSVHDCRMHRYVGRLLRERTAGGAELAFSALSARYRGGGRYMTVPVVNRRQRSWRPMRRDGLQLRRVREKAVERGPDTFNSTERVELKADELTLATVFEFVAMLRLVLKKSGLTAGQVAVKTSIARSSAYSLVAVTRTGLPVNPDQVRIFLGGCGLRLDQVDQVMRAWDRLKADHRGRRAGSGPESTQAPRQD